MRPEISNKFTVHCDICQEPMRWTATMENGYRAFICYPCNNVIYESQLYLYDGNVQIKEAKNDSK